MEPLSLNPMSQDGNLPVYTPVQEEPISIDLGLNPAAATPYELAIKRAYKAQMGVGTVLNKNKEQIAAAITEGQEDGLRKESASALDDIRTQARQRALYTLAVQKGANLTVEDVWERGAQPLYPGVSDPSSVFEQAYAEQYINQLDRSAENNPLSFWKQASLTIPTFTSAVKNVSTDYAAKQEYLRKEIEDAETTKHNQPWITAYEPGKGFGGTVGDIVKMGFPLLGQVYVESLTRGNVEGVPTMSSIGIGSDWEDQGIALFRQNFDQFKETIRKLEPIKKENPTLYAEYLQGLLGQTSTDKAINNLFTYSLGGDIAALGGAALKGVKGVARSAKTVELTDNVLTAAKDMVKSMADSAETPLSKATMSTAAGDLEQAAVDRSTVRMLGNVKGNPEPAIKQAADDLFTFFDQDIKDIGAGKGKLSQGLTNKLISQYEIRKKQIQEAFSNMLHPERIPMEAFSEAQMRMLLDDVKATYPDYPILNISNPYKVPYGSGWAVDLHMGTPQKTLWTNFQQAQNFIKTKELQDVHVGPDTKYGTGWYIKKSVPIDETTNVMRDILVNVKGGKSPSAGPIRSYISVLRTAEDTLSDLQRRNRKAATYPYAVIDRIANQDRKLLQDFKNGISRVDPLTGDKVPFVVREAKALGGEVTRRNAKRWEEFNRILKLNQTMDDPETGLKGYYFKSPEELQDAYLRTFERMADFDETQAYFANKRLAELDRINREISEYRFRHRVGAQSYRIIGNDPEDPIGAKTTSPYFDGMRKRDMPGGDDVIAVVGDDMKSIKLYSSDPGSIMPSERRKWLSEEIKAGRKTAIEIYNPEELPLKDFSSIIGDTQVRYVIANSFENKPLSWNHVPRRGGGHHIYDYELYMKMPIVTTERVGDTSTIINRYKGDATVMGVENRAMGEILRKQINEAIDLMEKGKMAEAQDLWISRHKIPWEWDDFKSRFLPKKDRITGRINPPQLSLSQRMEIVPRDKMIVDMNKNLEKRYEYLRENGTLGTTFVDGTRSGSTARQFITKFTGERDAYDLFHIRDVGTKGEPLWALETGKLIDPMPAMQLSLNRMINSRLMDDYKLAALEQWIREAAPILRAKESELRYAPLHHFSAAGDDSAWKSALTPEELALKNRLLGNRWKIKQLLGIPSKFDTLMHSVAQNLADWGYTNLGPKYGPLTPHWLLPKILDPVKYIRAMTFHAVMGLGAIWQFLVQQASYATMWAIAPRYSAVATYANMLHMWAKFNRNPAIMDALDKYATRLRIPGLPKYRPGELKEAIETMERTGFGQTGGTHIYLDDVTNYRVIESYGRKMLDAGLYPFKAAERNLMTGAWHIAFKEFRDVRPTGKITNDDLLKITDRADFLYGNMSRASASYLQHGLPSLGTQFLSFQMRLGEIFWGKRLGETAAERNWARLRMYMVYGSLFGYTTGAGITGLPIGDYLRKKAIDELGYVPGEKWWSSMFMEGGLATFLALLTGKGDTQKGTWYNIGQRFGAQGFTFINNLFRNDRPWWTSTAATSKIFDIGQDLDPYMQTIRTWIDGTDPRFKLKGEHLIAPLKEASAFNATWRFLAAANTGKWYSKNGTYLQDTSVLEAAFMTATGTQHQSVNDSYLKGDILREETAMQKWGLKHFVQEWRKGLQAVHDKDPDQADDYFANALSYLIVSGYPDEKFNAAVIIGDSSYYQNLVDNTNFRFYLEHPSRKRQQNAERIMGIIGDLKRKRGEQ